MSHLPQVREHSVICATAPLLQGNSTISTSQEALYAFLSQFCEGPAVEVLQGLQMQAVPRATDGLALRMDNLAGHLASGVHLIR